MSERQNAIRFFAKNAGYCSPPGRLVYARNLAIAEEKAAEAGACFSWEYDPDGDDSWMSKREREQPHECFGCVLRDEAGNVLASLWGIFDPSPEYSRVVEAELACEVEEVLDEIIRLQSLVSPVS